MRVRHRAKPERLAVYPILIVRSTPTPLFGDIRRIKGVRIAERDCNILRADNPEPTFNNKARYLDQNLPVGLHRVLRAGRDRWYVEARQCQTPSRTVRESCGRLRRGTGAA